MSDAAADFIIRGADLSDDGVYRYLLTRHWSRGARDVWIMLNPSTADALVDDPTIRRCMGFSRRWGAGGIDVVNLFALRATVPDELRTHPDPVGERNDAKIIDRTVLAHLTGGRVIAAWGSHAMAVHRSLLVRSMLDADRKPIHCLGTTRGGHPRHPLYVRGDTPLVPYS